MRDCQIDMGRVSCQCGEEIPFGVEEREPLLFKSKTLLCGGAVVYSVG